MDTRDRIFVGGGGEGYTSPQDLLLRLANRHGLIAGATGTGKTITMQVLAEGFSQAGVPVFLTDIKGDLGGMAVAGTPRDAFARRAAQIGLDDVGYAPCPVTFWDLFGQHGHPVRATIAEMGPLLLSRILELTEAQEGVINIAFRIADDEGLPILDLKDLQSMLQFLAENQREISARYGNVTTASVGAIQRRLLVLENQGAASFFGEPALALSDFMLRAADARGRVNILHAEKLMSTPRLYATFLLWLLSQLFEDLPEIGDQPLPKLVFFFDEAHLLFNGAPKALVEKVERVVRLIRSKGVGVYFVTQNPDDVPDTILAQLGNRVQHALRAFTARDQQALRRAAQTYRANPRFDTQGAIQDVGVGEAVTSFLEDRGAPGIVERTLIRPPASAMGPCDDAVRRQVIAQSPVAGKYDTLFDRWSAHEMLARRAEEAASQAQAEAAQAARDAERAREFNQARRYEPPARATSTRATPATTAPRTTTPRASTSRSDSPVDAFAKSFARQLGTKSGQALVRGVMGTLFRGR
jgi:DNA helicase HerA-like ATPase